MDEATVGQNDIQLALWGEEIQRREARLLTPGREPRFAAVLHVDELRVMLATAQARLKDLQAEPKGHQGLLTEEFDLAWKELAAAIDQRMPQP